MLKVQGVPREQILCASSVTSMREVTASSAAVAATLNTSVTKVLSLYRFFNLASLLLVPISCMWKENLFCNCLCDI